jgi:hypothetical protein
MPVRSQRAAQNQAAEPGRAPGGLQRQPLPARHPAAGPPRRPHRRDEGEAGHPAGHPRRARGRERPARRDADQRRRAGAQPVQDQRRVLDPVRDPAQATRIGSAGAGAIEGRHAQSQLARRRREQACRQPRIGQPVAEQNRCPARRASHLGPRSRCCRPGAPDTPHDLAFRPVAASSSAPPAHVPAPSCAQRRRRGAIARPAAEAGAAVRCNVTGMARASGLADWLDMELARPRLPAWAARLRRDPQCVLHSTVTGPDGGEGRDVAKRPV